MRVRVRARARERARVRVRVRLRARVRVLGSFTLCACDRLLVDAWCCHSRHRRRQCRCCWSSSIGLRHNCAWLLVSAAGSPVSVVYLCCPPPRMASSQSLRRCKDWVLSPCKLSRHKAAAWGPAPPNYQWCAA